MCLPCEGKCPAWPSLLCFILTFPTSTVEAPKLEEKIQSPWEKMSPTDQAEVLSPNRP